MHNVINLPPIWCDPKWCWGQPGLWGQQQWWTCHLAPIESFGPMVYFWKVGEHQDVGVQNDRHTNIVWSLKRQWKQPFPIVNTFKNLVAWKLWEFPRFWYDVLISAMTFMLMNVCQEYLWNYLNHLLPPRFSFLLGLWHFVTKVIAILWNWFRRNTRNHKLWQASHQDQGHCAS